MLTFKSISVKRRICDREMVKQFFEWKQEKSYERLKYVFPLDFDKYLSYLEVQKNSKVDIRKKDICSKSL